MAFYTLRRCLRVGGVPRFVRSSLAAILAVTEDRSSLTFLWT